MKRPSVSDEVWDQNYRAPGEEKLQDTWEREAKACAAVEKEEDRQQAYEDFLWLLSDFRGCAGGRITANLGVEGREATTLMNCFVHHPSDIKLEDCDSIAGIYHMLEAQAQTLKSEGGYGTNFSWIRPAGAYVKGIGGRTPGVLAFMELWNDSSKIITMGCEDKKDSKKNEEKNKIRKGAQMACLSCTHPDIEEFIDAKLVPGRFSKFNFSVGVTEGFMDAVINDKDWQLRFPDTNDEHYHTEWFGDLEDWESKGYAIVVYRTIKARALWDKIMQATYNRAEPGVLFLDTFNRMNPIGYAEKIHSTNPCGEVGISTGVCLLFSLNLVKFVNKNHRGRFEFDFDMFKKAVQIATRFADNINDLSRTPLPEYSHSMKQKRRIGMGVLGLGSLHYILGIRFGSEESLALMDRIFKIKAETELLASAKLGKLKGSFPLFDREKYFSSEWWKTLPISEDIKSEIEKIGEMRNSHQSANAPTGNMSVYVGCVSGGIEPVFTKEYTRWIGVTEEERATLRKQGLEFPDVSKGEWFENDIFRQIKRGSDNILIGEFNSKRYQIDSNRGLTKANVVEDYGWRFVKENFTDDELSEMEARGVFATTNDLQVKDHINSLRVISKYVNMSSSKTVNVPNDYPYEDFKNLYLDAWKVGIKGLTTYRAGTMMAVLEDNEQKPEKKVINLSHAPKRPNSLESQTHKMKMDCGGNEGPRNTYVIVSFFPGTKRPYEVFIQVPYSGLDEKDLQILELTARSTSMSLRHGLPIKYICEQLEKIGGQYIFSVPTNLAKILRQYIEYDNEVIDDILTEEEEEESREKCPKCHARAYQVTGTNCGICHQCGYSGCS